MDIDVIELKAARANELTTQILKWIKVRRQGLTLSDGVRTVNVRTPKVLADIDKAIGEVGVELRAELQAIIDVLPGGD